MYEIAVIGAGSWGTTLADLLGRKGFGVRLWAREEEVCRSIEERRENTLFLPGVRLSENVKAGNGIGAVISGAGLVVNVAPSHGVREVFNSALPFIAKDAVIVSAAKGIEDGTLLTPVRILEDVLKDAPHKAIAALSGPTFAKEVSQGLPAAIVAASSSADAAVMVQKAFSTPYFRVYTSADVIGVEIGGALKNVIAIASGISDGLGLGANARAALITRGLAEMSRLGSALGANPLTLSGLSGLGDLVLTCTGPLSRNYSTGIAIGKGKSLAEAAGGTPAVAEGIKTSKAAAALAAKTGVDMPITCEVCKVLHESKSPKDAVMELMTRGLKDELG